MSSNSLSINQKKKTCHDVYLPDGSDCPSFAEPVVAVLYVLASSIATEQPDISGKEISSAAKILRCSAT